jgi:hypothetical protein
MENISISFNIHITFLAFGILLLIAFSYYAYHFTIPSVSKKIRLILFSLRSCAVVLLLLLIFEPLLTVINRRNIEPTSFIFIDNSNSIAHKDSVKRINQIKELSNKILTTYSENVKVYLFGQNVRSVAPNTLEKLKLDEPLTNFSNIFSSFQKEKNSISSAVIISDGIINDGLDPLYNAERSPFPIFTVGIGDSTQFNDLFIKDIIYNQYIYAGKETELELLIYNVGFENRQVSIQMYEEGKSFQTQTINLNSSGINRIIFPYTPIGSGEKKIDFRISSIENEENKTNNSKSILLNVLNNKLKITVVSGRPSPDLSSIIQALEADKNLDIYKLIQITPQKFWQDISVNVIDSADVIFLIDFPTSNTPPFLNEKIFDSIQNNKPFFILVSASTDLQKIKQYEKYLPFTIGQIRDETILVNSEITSIGEISTFSKFLSIYKNWQKLPPLIRNTTEIITKPGSNTLLRAVVKNIPINTPIFISRNIANERSISFIGGDIWRWQLATADNNPNFFSNFINDIVKWLNVSQKQKQFSVRTNKKVYSIGEEIIFTAELYDQTFAPIDSAFIELNIFNEKEKSNIILKKVKEGIFSTNFAAIDKGDYRFEATAKFNNSSVKSNSGRFIVSETNLEKEITKMNTNILKQIAGLSRGNYFDITDDESLIDELIKIKNNSKKEIIVYGEYHLWSEEITLIIILLLFSVEWFLRKRIGML